jgi:hypothetical protein
MSDTPAPGNGCELCWQMAYERIHLFGGDQMEHYMKLLKETEGMLGHRPGDTGTKNGDNQ